MAYWPTFDSDGNLLSEVRIQNSVVSENRLIMVSNSTTVVTFAYDYMGRRFSKIVDNGTSITTNFFVYDGWNMIAEGRASSPSEPGVTNYYTWGLDLSGTLQGAGGIGGLLSVTECSTGSTNQYFTSMDANGNITEYADTNGTIVAHYEYNPFGGLITSSGTKANDFKFRFSTKYFDTETGLYYYGYRFYSSELGRWVSRDPIEEVGSYPSIIVKQMLFYIFSEYRNAYLRLALNKDGNLSQRIAYIEVAGRYNKLLHFIIIGEPTIMLSFYGANNYINSMNNLIDYFDIFWLSDNKCPPDDKDKCPPDDKDKCPPGDKAKVGSAGPWILGLGGGGLISSGLALAKANVRRSITTPLMVVGAISSVLGTIWGTVIPDKEEVEKKIKSNGGGDLDSWWNMRNGGDDDWSPDDSEALKEICDD